MNFLKNKKNIENDRPAGMQIALIGRKFFFRQIVLGFGQFSNSMDKI
jgi:hypothetical protein